MFSLLSLLSPLPPVSRLLPPVCRQALLPPCLVPPDSLCARALALRSLLSLLALLSLLLSFLLCSLRSCAQAAPLSECAHESHFVSLLSLLSVLSSSLLCSPCLPAPCSPCSPCLPASCILPWDSCVGWRDGGEGSGRLRYFSDQVV